MPRRLQIDCNADQSAAKRPTRRSAPLRRCALWQAPGMQLRPRYGTDPVITLDGRPSDILAPVVRQRRRLNRTLTSFDEQQWAYPSRCAGWSNRDVIVHLDSTNTFWNFSIAAGLRGEPTQFLATFDPVASPAQMVAGSNLTTTAEVLDRFTTSTDALLSAMEELDADGWETLAEAPPGHISISALAHHALWDSWVHERDILLPLGMHPNIEDDEVVACLRYASALGPAFAITNGTASVGTLAISVAHPMCDVVVDIDRRAAVREGTTDGAFALTGDAVQLVEALSIRAPLAQTVPPESRWMVSGLAEVFESEPLTS